MSHQEWRVDNDVVRLTSHNIVYHHGNRTARRLPCFRGFGETVNGLYSAAASASVAFLAPIQATIPNPILLMMSAML